MRGSGSGGPFVSALDWEHLGVQLLERERRPVLVLDADGRVQRANRAFLSLLPDGSRTHLVDFRKEWLAERSRTPFDAAMKQLKRDGRSQVTVALTNTLFPLDLVLELVRFGQGKTPAVMAVMVDAVSRTPTLPLRPTTGLTYEVTTTGHDPWTVTRVVAAEGHPMASLEPGVPCWVSVFGRRSECVGCPLKQLSANGRTTSVLDRRPERFEPMLVVAERMGNRATVTAHPIDAKAWELLTQARIDHVATNARLNAKEREVLALLVMGRALEDIATAASITVRTAKYHQQKILKKVGADSRLDLVRLIL